MFLDSVRLAPAQHTEILAALRQPAVFRPASASTFRMRVGNLTSLIGNRSALPASDRPYFPFACHRKLMQHAMKYRSLHTDYAIREHAVVVIYVPEIKGCENDEQSHENSHLVSLSRFV
jgi:hypothetical protein